MRDTNLLTSAVKQGLRDALAHWPSAVLLYAAVLLPGILVGYLFQTSLVSAFGNSGALETLSEGFVFTTVLDLATQEGFRLSPLLSLSLVLLLLSLPLQAFLTAGVVSSLKESGSWSSHLFFAGAARHIGGFFLVSLLTLLIGSLVMAGTLAAAAFLVVETENASHPGVLMILSLGLVLTACLITISEYTRIHIVQDPDGGLPGGLRAAVDFSFRHAGMVIALATALAGVSLLPLAGVIAVDIALPASVGGWLATLVIVQQAAVLLRSWIRVFAFALQSAFVRTAHGALRPGEPPPTPSPLLTRGI